MRSWRPWLAGGMPRLLIVLHDLGMVWVCWIGLHRIRYSYVANPLELPLWSVEAAIVLLAQGLVFWQVGLYRGLWRFASLPDLWNILRASLIGLLAIIIGLALYDHLQGVSRMVLGLYPLMLSALLGAPRMLYRMWKDSRGRLHNAAPSRRILVLGAGRAGEMLVRDLRHDNHYRPVGFLDDNRSLRGAKIHGLPVLGTLDELEEIARESAVEMIVIAMPSAEANTIRQIVQRCDESGLPFRTVPRLEDLLQGRAAPGELKKVAIEDLLGRDQVMPDWDGMRAWLGGRSVLVTGAGGSIGSELCRQCAQLGVGALTLLEQSELALISIGTELRKTYPQLRVTSILGDCSDPATCAHALASGRPDAVFHAAAYKHVPLLQGQLREAIRNNVLATARVARASRDAGVGTFVLISTDKAVDPVSVLGASKRLAEMACRSIAQGTTNRFITVRFGNVLDSAGSVVPLFRKQIRSGGPVTVTHPDVSRFFMTIPEACQLILQAAAIDTREAIYTLDMGAPVPIRMLAEQMIRLSGKQLGRDIRIEYIGLRPGEKLHEALFHCDEQYARTAHPKIMLARPRDVDVATIEAALTLVEDAVRRYDEPTLARLLREVLPDFEPDRADHGQLSDITGTTRVEHGTIASP